MSAPSSAVMRRMPQRLFPWPRTHLRVEIMHRRLDHPGKGEA
jgi:hypothetical protein